METIRGVLEEFSYHCFLLGKIETDGITSNEELLLKFLQQLVTETEKKIRISILTEDFCKRVSFTQNMED